MKVLIASILLIFSSAAFAASEVNVAVNGMVCGFCAQGISKKFLKEAAANNYILFLEHDSVNECCTVIQTERGVRLDKTFALKEIL